jgi:hypothetical protein
MIVQASPGQGMRSNSLAAGTSSALARVTIVGKRGARLAPSIFEIAVVCRPEARERSSWDQPRSARSALRFAAKRSRGVTPDSFWALAQEAKRHIEPKETIGLVGPRRGTPSNASSSSAQALAPASSACSYSTHPPSGRSCYPMTGPPLHPAPQAEASSQGC